MNNIITWRLIKQIIKEQFYVNMLVTYNTFFRLLNSKIIQYLNYLNKVILLLLTIIIMLKMSKILL